MMAYLLPGFYFRRRTVAHPKVERSLLPTQCLLILARWRQDKSFSIETTKYCGKAGIRWMETVTILAPTLGPYFKFTEMPFLQCPL